MKTREDYLNEKCTHKEYYSQFVTEDIKKMVVNAFGVENLKLALSHDEYMNTIPLKMWDRLSYSVSIMKQMRAHGDYQTLAGTVCTLKEAARQVVEANS